MAKARKKRSGTLHFGSKKAYRDFLAYEHIHLRGPHGRKKVEIAGRPHRVKHGG